MVGGVKQLLLMIVVVALVGCGGKSGPVNIADPILEKAIRMRIKKPTGELTEADLEEVTSLSFDDKKLTEVPKGLEKLPHLFGLTFYENQLASVKGLKKLTQLEGLGLHRNKLTSVKGLGKLTELRELYLSYNQLTDVKALEKLMQLEGLELKYNPALTKTQIDELQKALPKCKIDSNPIK